MTDFFTYFVNNSRDFVDFPKHLLHTNTPKARHESDSGSIIKIH